MGPEDNPAEDAQPIKEEWEQYERERYEADLKADAKSARTVDRSEELRLHARIIALEDENRRLRLLIPMTMAEAEDAMNDESIPSIPMTDEEIDRILKNILRMEAEVRAAKGDK